MLLVSNVLLDMFPANDWSSLFDQHQTGVHQNEYVTGYVESIPKVPAFQACWFRVQAPHIAPAVNVFDVVERFGVDKPNRGGDRNAGHVMDEHAIGVASR